MKNLKTAFIKNKNFKKPMIEIKEENFNQPKILKSEDSEREREFRRIRKRNNLL